LGWPREEQERAGRSASRKRRSAEEVAHFGRWR
jgi:hypothetical protein